MDWTATTQLSAQSPLLYNCLKGFRNSKEMFVLLSVGFQKGLNLAVTGRQSTTGNTTDTVSHSRLFPSYIVYEAIFGVLTILISCNAQDKCLSVDSLAWQKMPLLLLYELSTSFELYVDSPRGEISCVVIRDPWLVNPLLFLCTLAKRSTC